MIVLVKENIFRFDVSMENRVCKGVKIFDCLQYFLQVAFCHVLWQPFIFFQFLIQSAIRHILQKYFKVVFVAKDIVKLKDVGMTKFLKDLNFPDG